MHKLTYLILHCSATPEGRDVQTKDIIAWHTAKPPVGHGWSKVGYSDFITLNGVIHNLNVYNSDEWVDVNEVTNGVLGFNSISRHICYAGGMTKDNKAAKDTRTAAQLKSMEAYVKKTVAEHPGILVGGHNQFSSKACPSFDTVKWLRSIGIPEKNIYKKP